MSNSNDKAGNSKSSNDNNTNNNNYDVEHSMQVDADITDFVRSYRNEQDDRLKKKEEVLGQQSSYTDKRCSLFLSLLINSLNSLVLGRVFNIDLVVSAAMTWLRQF